MLLRETLTTTWNHIQGFVFPMLREEVGPLTAQHERLVIVLDTAGIEPFVKTWCGFPGRPLEDRASLARAFLAKAVLNLPTTSSLIERLCIDATLRGVSTDVTKRLNELNTELQNLRESSSRQYGSVEEAVSALAKRTDNLKDILSNSQKRGQWGERLAEDILRSAGFVEGKNYSKQQQIEGGGKPDYRFEMPPDRVLFMDVKFPLDQYSLYIAAEDDAVRAQAKKQFLDALHGHITALAKRDYLDKADNNTIDYVLMFVPNESISSFVHEADPELIDTDLEQKVVLCTPLTLYAFLVVIRQATDSFHTEQNAADIMKRINLFNKEWAKYTEAVKSVEDQFKKMIGTIESINVDGTRFKKLNVHVREIEKIRKREGIAEVDAAAAETLELESGDE